MNIIEERKFLLALFKFINNVPCINIRCSKDWKDKIDYLYKNFIIDDDLINNYNQILIKNGYNPFRKKYFSAYTQWGFSDRIQEILNNHFQCQNLKSIKHIEFMKTI
jgi:hypothetical protein